jgi:hypothetical protein
MPRLLTLTTALLLLATAPAAQANWFPSEGIDGPAEIDALGDVDLARDGQGGVVYIKRDGGVPQVFLSRIRAGAWQPPQKVTTGAAVSEATVSAADGGRLVIAWVAGGDVGGTVIDGDAAPAPATPLSSGGGATGLSVDMGINGTAYAVWAQNGDIRAARLQSTTWELISSPLDVDPARPAGADQLRPRVAVSAEGNAIATWGEAEHPDGRTHVYGRRLTGLTPSAFPQDITLNDFEGMSAGNAESPDIDVEDDGSFAWVAFRQDVGGRSRTVARRLLGSQFEPPVAIDGGATSFEPRIDFNGKGIGEAVSQTAENTVVGAYLSKFDTFDPGSRVDGGGSGVPPTPLVATSERGDATVAWRTGGADGSGSARARTKQGEEGFAEEVLASKPELGPVAERGVALAADRSGNVAVVTLQGAPGARWIAAALYDRLPGRPFPISSNRQPRQPLLKWKAGSEAWGPQRYEVFVDGRSAGTTEATEMRVGPYRASAHRWYVTSTDRRGQLVRSTRTYSFRVDPYAPRLRPMLFQRGRTVSVRVRANDRGSGVRDVLIDWGDGHRTHRSRGTHRFDRGRYTITVRVTDWARNVTSRRFSVRVRR